MTEIRYTFTQTGAQDVANAFKDIAGAASASRVAVQRSYRDAPKQAARAGKTTKRQSMNEFSELERMVKRSQDRRSAMTRDASTTRMKEQMKQAKAVAKEEAKRAKEAQKAFERAEKAKMRATQRRHQAMGRALGMGGQLALRGVAVAVGAAAAITGRAVREDIRLEDRAQGLAVRGSGRFGESPVRSGRSITRQFRRMALESPGISTADMMGGAEAFVEKTGDLDKAVAFAPTLAKVGLATGASQAQLGSVAADLQKKFNINTAGEMQQALSTLAVQGKRGQFELLDFAKQIPKIAASAQRFGVGQGKEPGAGARGVEQLGALAQIARLSTRSGSEAGTAVENLFRELTLKADKTKMATGVDVFTDKSRTQTRDIENLIPEIIGGAKGNLTTLQQLFGTRGIRAISSLITTFNEATKSGKSNAEAMDEVRKEFDKAKQATGARAEIERDAAIMSKTNSAQLTAAWESFMQVVSTNLTPTITSLITKFSNLVNNTDFMDQVANSLQAFAGALDTTINLLQKLNLLKSKEVSPEEEKAEIKRQIEQKTEERNALRVVAGGAFDANDPRYKRFQKLGRERRMLRGRLRELEPEIDTEQSLVQGKKGSRYFGELFDQFQKGGKPALKADYGLLGISPAVGGAQAFLANTMGEMTEKEAKREFAKLLTRPDADLSGLSRQQRMAVQSGRDAIAAGQTIDDGMIQFIGNQLKREADETAGGLASVTEALEVFSGALASFKPPGGSVTVGDRGMK